MGVEVVIDEDQDTEALLAKLPLALRNKYLVKGLRAEGNVIKKVAKAEYPRSIETGSRSLWSRATAAEREAAKELADAVGVVVRDYGDTFVMLVGPVEPFWWAEPLEFGHEVILHGKPTGQRVPPNPVMRRSVEASASARGDLLAQTILVGIESEVR